MKFILCKSVQYSRIYDDSKTVEKISWSAYPAVPIKQINENPRLYVYACIFK